MYDPKEAEKSYYDLFRKNSFNALLQSMFIIFIWFLISECVLLIKISSIFFYIGFFFSALFFTFKPKLIRFLRGILRGAEYRDRSD